MQLSNASRVCSKINENVAYSFLFRTPELEIDEQIEVFVEEFSEKNGLIATSVAPQKWVFSHNEHGQLDDGVVELVAETDMPKFKFNDVSKAKITENSPDLPRDLESVAFKVINAHSEYTEKLKSGLGRLNAAIKNLSSLVQNRDGEPVESLEITEELSNLQRNYHLMLDKVFEMQSSDNETSIPRQDQKVESSIKALNDNIVSIHADLDHLKVQ